MSNDAIVILYIDIFLVYRQACAKLVLKHKVDTGNDNMCAFC
jgi:hypothetical protein